jgi:hypothetical protein
VNEKEVKNEVNSVKVERFKKTLKVLLTEEEIASRADRAAHLIAERDNKESEAKATAAAVKAQINALDAEHRELSCEVRDKATYRSVECRRVFDYKRGVVTEERIDTGMQIDIRALDDEERQLGFDILQREAKERLRKDSDAGTKAKAEAKLAAEALPDTDDPASNEGEKSEPGELDADESEPDLPTRKKPKTPRKRKSVAPEAEA